LRHLGTDNSSARDVHNEVGAGFGYCAVEREHADEIDHDVAEINVIVQETGSCVLASGLAFKECLSDVGHRELYRLSLLG